MTDPKDSSSFFRKVVKFVASPSTDWAELVSSNSIGQESEFAKTELKAMIERKRRNDFVRKREFDTLRRVRREGLTGEQLATFTGTSRLDEHDERGDGNAKPSEVKAKIDEIEQQMVGEGLSGLHRRNTSFYAALTQPSKLDTGLPTLGEEELLQQGLSLGEDSSAQDQRQAPTPRAPSNISSKLGALNGSPPAPLPAKPPPRMTVPVLPLGAALPPAAILSADSLLIRSAPEPGASPSTAARHVPREQDRLSTRPAPVSGLENLGSTPAALPRIGVSNLAIGQISDLGVHEISQDHDPELDEAVIAFANADFDVCAQSLLDLISPEGARPNDHETWLALFDLYRAIGEHHKFEELALEYAGRFGRSSPQWFSMPKMLADAAITDDNDVKKDLFEAGFLGWVCPEHLDEEAVATLRSQTIQMPQPWVFDWADLTTIEPQACGELADIFNAWAGKKLDMQWMGGGRIFTVLADACAVGDRDVDPVYWRLRLEALRLANRQRDFDDVAIDYCVTYEVSPPSWAPATCQVLIRGAGNSTSALPLSTVSDISTCFVESQIAEDDALVEMASLELSGQLVGDISPLLTKLNAQLRTAPVVCVSCTNLIRVDFIAAGDLLNWVLAMRSQNRSITFTDTHRLVALFFSAMGINEHATVKIKKI